MRYGCVAMFRNDGRCGEILLRQNKQQTTSDRSINNYRMDPSMGSIDLSSRLSQKEGCCCCCCCCVCTDGVQSRAQRCCYLPDWKESCACCCGGPREARSRERERDGGAGGSIDRLRRIMRLRETHALNKPNTRVSQSVAVLKSGEPTKTGGKHRKGW